MGTSTSSKGRKSSTPLVPSWAIGDEQLQPTEGVEPIPGEEAGPESEPADTEPAPIENGRFRAFRTDMGRFAATSDVGAMKSALRSYATSATGGASAAFRRMASAFGSGASVWGFAQDLAAGGAPIGPSGVSLAACIGMPVDEAIEIIVAALAPTNEDGDLVRTCMADALSEILQDVHIFTAAALDADSVSALMVAYLSQLIFKEMIQDAGRAFQKAESVLQARDAELVLFEFVKSDVERIFTSRMASALGTPTATDMLRIQGETLREVWRDWEEL